MSCGPDIPPPPKLFDLEMVTDRDTYAAGENVTAQISLANVYDQAYTVKPSPPTVDVEELYTSEVVAIFPGIEEERLLQPGQSLNWSVSWDQKDQGGNQVSPGRYIFELECWIFHDGIETHISDAAGSIIKIEATEE
jgi:hypothetical protein